MTVRRKPVLRAPASPVVYEHRAGWNLHREERDLIAVKAIPPGSDNVLRTLRIAVDEKGKPTGAAELCVGPNDARPEEPFAYTVSELLVLILTRRSRALLVHGACVETKSGGLLFPGRSGSGKSTMAGIWDKAGKGTVLGDESHLVWRDAAGRLVVGGTPWPGSSGLYANRIAPLRGVYFLEHGQRNALHAVGPAEAALALMSHAYLPAWDRQAMETVTELASRIAEETPSARLAFVPDEAVVEYVWNAAQQD